MGNKMVILSFSLFCIHSKFIMKILFLTNFLFFCDEKCSCWASEVFRPLRLHFPWDIILGSWRARGRWKIQKGIFIFNRSIQQHFKQGMDGQQKHLSMLHSNERHSYYVPKDSYSFLISLTLRDDIFTVSKLLEKILCRDATLSSTVDHFLSSFF